MLPIKESPVRAYIIFHIDRFKIPHFSTLSYCVMIERRAFLKYFMKYCNKQTEAASKHLCDLVNILHH